MKNFSKILFSAAKGNALKLDEEGVYIINLALDYRVTACLLNLSKEKEISEIKTLIDEYNTANEINNKIEVDAYINTLSKEQISFLIASLNLLSVILKDEFKNINEMTFDESCKKVALCNMMKDYLEKINSGWEGDKKDSIEG